MTHHFLYWLSTGWWCLGLAHAPLLCTSKTCPLLLHLPWFGGSSVHSAAHPWPLMVWIAFLFLIPYSLLLPRAGPCLIVGFFSFSLFFASSVILLPFSVIPLCCSCRGIIWLMPVGPLWACLFFSQWLNMVITFILMLLWAFPNPFHCLWALLSHFFLLEHLWPICFPWLVF